MYRVKLDEFYNIDQNKLFSKSEVKLLLRNLNIVNIGKKLLSNGVQVGEIVSGEYKKDSIEFDTLFETEKKHIEKLNELTSNKTYAAKLLGITVKTLYNKIEKHNIKWK